MKILGRTSLFFSGFLILLSFVAVLATFFFVNLESMLRLSWWIGKLHPMLIHFPIAFVIAAALIETYNILRGRKVSTYSYYFLLLSFFCLLPAIASGGLNYLFLDVSPLLNRTLNFHVWSGLLVFTLVTLSLLLFKNARTRDTFPLQRYYRLTVIAAGVFIGLSAHYGGILVHGSDYWREPLVSAIPRTKPLINLISTQHLEFSSDPLEDEILTELATVNYESHIQPIIERSCLRCHQEGRSRGELDLGSRDGFLEGGSRGPIVVKGKSKESLLYRVIAGKDPEIYMPEKGTALRSQEIQLIQQWIDDGLKWYSDEKQSEYEDELTPDKSNYQFANLVYNQLPLLNGDIFWSPATLPGSSSIDKFGDEIAAVFGRPPAVTCQDGVTIGINVQGRKIEIIREDDVWKFKKEGDDLVFDRISRCDEPVLAAGITPCSINSTLVRLKEKEDSPIIWYVLCRKSWLREPLRLYNQGEEYSGFPYWHEENPLIKNVGVIGYNQHTGETVFLDTNKDELLIRSDIDRAPPGGKGYFDKAGRKEATEIWDKDFSENCLKCHDNRTPWKITPHLRNQYKYGEKMENSILPDYRPDQAQPYRPIGTQFTNNYARWINNLRTIDFPACTSCHTLSTGETKTFVKDAIAGRYEGAPPDSWFFNNGAFLTEWAKQNIHPWMLAENEKGVAGALSLREREDLIFCLENPGDRNDPSNPCNPAQAFTRCVPPDTPYDNLMPQISKYEAIDDSSPQFLEHTLTEVKDSDSFDQVLTINWEYRNSFGQVLTRDDVRFYLAVREIPLLAAPSIPSPDDYPSFNDARAEAAELLGNKAAMDKLGNVIIRNISHHGHNAFSDPEPLALDKKRLYSVALPVRFGHRYTFRLLAKRFCFDISGNVFSEKDDEHANIYFVDM